MKILWFANSPCGAKEILLNTPITSGGWLSSLADSIVAQTNIQLHIGFYWGKQLNAFDFKGVTYHPILRDNSDSKLGRYINRLRQQFSSAIDETEIIRVENVVREVNPDLIHFHGSEENFGLIAERIDDIPMVLSIQGLLSPYHYKYYSGYQKNDLYKGESFIVRLLRDGYVGKERSLYHRSLIEKRIFRCIHNYIGRTCWDKDCSLSLNSSRRYFVCNEILRSEFLSGVWRKPNNQKIILSTTISFGLYKGLEMVFETAKLLKEQHINYEWNVIGVSKEDSIVSITQKIKDSDYRRLSINLLGRKNAKEMTEIFNCSNAFVQVSHIENSPNSLCEAMALGMPIIASYAGGTSSLLEDGKEGVIVQDGDPYRLAGAIINMFDNYDQAIAMGIRARERALARHNPTNVVSELLYIYKKLLSN